MQAAKKADELSKLKDENKSLKTQVDLLTEHKAKMESFMKALKGLSL